METILKIGEIDVKIKTSADIPRMYRKIFGKDLFLQMIKFETAQAKGEGLDGETIEMFENLAFCFAKHADPEIKEDVVEWLDQFGNMDIFTAIPDIYRAWLTDGKSTSNLKKKSGK